MGPSTDELIAEYLTWEEQTRLRDLEQALTALPSTVGQRLEWGAELSRGLTKLLAERGARL